MNSAFFDNLFILDMANNHQGSVDHGLAIVRAVAAAAKSNGVRAAIKFQYRQLDTFIHPNYVQATEPKHIPRFFGTRLSMGDYKVMVDEAKRLGLVTVCTPFDEESVPVIEEHEIDVIKIASCSCRDWPLLEKVASARKPVVVSVGGAAVADIDALVSFFSHRKIRLALMHCVSIYPTLDEDLQLNQIDYLKRRYPFLPVGFSTHEEQNNFEAVQIAVAKGALLLERHVGLPTEAIKLNAYSSTPEQMDRWMRSAARAWQMCGARTRLTPKKEEADSLNGLRRGVFARRPLAKGQSVDRSDLFFAMPYIDGGMDTSMLTVHSAGLVADRDYAAAEALSPSCSQVQSATHSLFSIIHQAKGLLYEGRIAIGHEFGVTLSHHYGIERFRDVGAIVIDCINREYCKKLIVQVPGQFHPRHYHERKEETFQVLYGELLLNLEGKELILRPGDQVLVDRGQVHSFTTKTGVVVEEISTTHFLNDSFYDDPNIVADPSLRKTRLEDAQHTFEQYDFSRLW